MSAEGVSGGMLTDDRSRPRDNVVLDVAALEARLPELRDAYAAATPFPHIVLDDFLVPAVARQAMEDFAAVDPKTWLNWVHVNEWKYGNQDTRTWNRTLQAIAGELNSPGFVDFLSKLTGIEDLLIDESMEGGGLHQSLPGGYLNVHADFTVHPHHRQWRRRINLLLYFNFDWRAEYGGELELWNADMKQREKSILPLGNRAVIFNTDSDAFHGHPEPLRCPAGTARRSLALYYFTSEDRPLVRSTEYRARPGDGRRALAIYLDKQLLRTYDRIKRSLGLSDHAASRLLGRVGHLKRRRRGTNLEG